MTTAEFTADQWELVPQYTSDSTTPAYWNIAPTDFTVLAGYPTAQEEGRLGWIIETFNHSWIACNVAADNTYDRDFPTQTEALNHAGFSTTPALEPYVW